MSGPIVHSLEPITLVGGGAASDREIGQALAIAPGLVAADGGAASCLRAGHIPQAVIGDMDSIDVETRQKLTTDSLFPIAEQDSTDFDKVLRHVSAPMLLGLGFMGGRADHQLAAFNSLVCHPHQRCLLIGDSDIVFLAPPVLRLDLPKGCRVSLFPMGRVEGRSRGLEWPIGGLSFSPDGKVGTSNRAEGGDVELELTAPKMLVILPVSQLHPVARALHLCASRWSAL